MINNQPLGWWGSAAHGSGTSIGKYSKDYMRTPIEDSALGMVVNLSGYPVNLNAPGPNCAPSNAYTNTAQWSAFGTVLKQQNMLSTDSLPELFGHEVDASAGQSGSPIWVYYDGGARILVGVHTGPALQLPAMSILCEQGKPLENRAIVVTSEVWDQVTSWIDIY